MSNSNNVYMQPPHEVYTLTFHCTIRTLQIILLLQISCIWLDIVRDGVYLFVLWVLDCCCGLCALCCFTCSSPVYLWSTSTSQCTAAHQLFPPISHQSIPQRSFAVPEPGLWMGLHSLDPREEQNTITGCLTSTHLNWSKENTVLKSGDCALWKRTISIY